jgi:hypothetical protein
VSGDSGDSDGSSDSSDSGDSGSGECEVDVLILCWHVDG